MRLIGFDRAIDPTEARVARSALMHWAESHVVPHEILSDLDALLQTAPSTDTHPQQRQRSTLRFDRRRMARHPTIRSTEPATHNLTQQLIASELRKAEARSDRPTLTRLNGAWPEARLQYTLPHSRHSNTSH